MAHGLSKVPKKKIADLIQDFIDQSNLMGYEIKGSVFKADFNGKRWSVGFWIRPARLKLGVYELPGRIGKAQNVSLRAAVKKAIERATLGEE